MKGVRPCPWCGRYYGDEDGTMGDWDEDLYVEEVGFLHHPDLYQVRCNNCQAYGPAMHSKEDAIAEWNRRCIE